MKTLNWSWTKFLMGISLDKMPNMKMQKVWVFGLHVGFFTLLVAPNWDPDGILTINE